MIIFSRIYVRKQNHLEDPRIVAATFQPLLAGSLLLIIAVGQPTILDNNESLHFLSKSNPKKKFWTDHRTEGFVTIKNLRRLVETS